MSIRTGVSEDPAAVIEKFRTYAGPRLPASRVDNVIDAVSRLETLGSARTLMELLGSVDAAPLRQSAAA